MITYYRFLCLLACSSIIFTTSCQSSNAATDGDVIAEDIDASTFINKMQEENVVILDVRTPPEIAKGKISGAMEIDYRSADFTTQLAALDKDKTYLVYCASGGRSGKTIRQMAKEGFRESYNLLGGYTAWKAEQGQ